MTGNCYPSHYQLVGQPNDFIIQFINNFFINHGTNQCSHYNAENTHCNGRCTLQKQPHLPTEMYICAYHTEESYIVQSAIGIEIVSQPTRLSVPSWVNQGMIPYYVVWARILYVSGDKMLTIPELYD
jgi:hypothetical protein